MNDKISAVRIPKLGLMERKDYKNLLDPAGVIEQIFIENVEYREYWYAFKFATKKHKQQYEDSLKKDKKYLDEWLKEHLISRELIVSNPVADFFNRIKFWFVEKRRRVAEKQATKRRSHGANKLYENIYLKCNKCGWMSFYSCGHKDVLPIGDFSDAIIHIERNFVESIKRCSNMIEVQESLRERQKDLHAMIDAGLNKDVTNR